MEDSRRNIFHQATAIVIDHDDSNMTHVNFNHSPPAIIACPCERIYQHYECISSTPKLDVTDIELRWCLKSSSSKDHQIGSLNSLIVTHGHDTSVRIKDGIACYETFPTTMDHTNNVIRTYMGNGFGHLIRRGFRAIFHRHITIDGAVWVVGELQSFSIVFPVKSIRFLPILKGRGWRYPGQWFYWVVRSVFCFLCLFVTGIFFWMIRIVWVWRKGNEKTLATIFGVPEPSEMTVPETEIQLEDKKELKAMYDTSTTELEEISKDLEEMKEEVDLKVRGIKI